MVEPVQLTINEDGSATGTLVVSDPDGDTNFTYAVTTQPSGGTAAFSSEVPGQFTYTPNLDFNGNDQFTVTVTDTSGGGGGATVTIIVTAENDAPVAFPQSVETNEDTAIAVTLIAADVENDPLTYAVVTGPTHGALSGTAPNLVYTPADNYFGGDTFTFTANDGELDSALGTVTITVLEVNDPPVAVPDLVTVNQNSGVNQLDLLTNDIDIEGDLFFPVSVSQPANGTTAIVGGVVTYAPGLNFVGSDSFLYTIGDGSRQNFDRHSLRHGRRPGARLGLRRPADTLEEQLQGQRRQCDPAQVVLHRRAGQQPAGPKCGCPSGNPDQGPVRLQQGETVSTLEVVNDSGSSDLRYSGDSWQFNWDTERAGDRLLQHPHRKRENQPG